MLRDTIFFLLLCIAVISCLFVTIHWLTLDQYSLVRWAAYLMPWHLVVLLPALALAVYCRRHRSLVVFLALPVLYVAACLAPEVFPGKIAASHGTPIKVITFNTWSKNLHADKTFEIFRDHTPDFLLLQEVVDEHLQDLRKRLDQASEDRPVYVSYDSSQLLAIVSLHPIKPLADKTSSRAKTQRVQATVGTDLISIYNIHYLRGAAHRRREAIESLILVPLATEDAPAIVAGDFNTTSQTASYSALKKRLLNSHDAAGAGFGFTFPSGVSVLPEGFVAPGFVRIDHIFFSRHFSAQSSKPLKIHTGSDHYPVVAELTLLHR